MRLWNILSGLTRYKQDTTTIFLSTRRVGDPRPCPAPPRGLELGEECKQHAMSPSVLAHALGAGGSLPFCTRRTHGPER